jgi:hypothetical protein
MIVNIDPAHKPGSHWVVLGCKEYFDPLGLPPLNKSVITYLNKCGKNWWLNPFTIQKYNTSFCGQFCIYYISKRCIGYTPTRIVNQLKMLRNPGNYVYNYVNKM